MIFAGQPQAQGPAFENVHESGTSKNSKLSRLILQIRTSRAALERTGLSGDFVADRKLNRKSLPSYTRSWFTESGFPRIFPSTICPGFKKAEFVRPNSRYHFRDAYVLKFH
jgi:hypothetical protein